MAPNIKIQRAGALRSQFILQRCTPPLIWSIGGQSAAAHADGCPEPHPGVVAGSGGDLQSMRPPVAALMENRAGF